MPIKERHIFGLQLIVDFNGPVIAGPFPFTTMRTRLIRLLNDVDIDNEGAWRCGGKHCDYVPLRQGNLDRGCAFYCVLMALLSLGLVSRQEVDAFARSKKTGGRLEQLWEAAGGRFFVGAYAAQIAGWLRRCPELASVDVMKPNRESLFMKVVAGMEEQRVSLLHIVNRKRKLNHWVMAIGATAVRTPENFDVDGLMILDPNQPVIPLAAWNAMVLPTRDSGMLYETATDAFPIRLSGFVQIGFPKKCDQEPEELRRANATKGCVKKCRITQKRLLYAAGQAARERKGLLGRLRSV